MLKVALVGTWHVHFSGYAKEIAKRDDCVITVLWDDNEDRGKQKAQAFGCPFEPDYDKLLAREDVQAIVVNTATNLHPEILTKAAAAKKHIFTEKVLCAKVEDALMVEQAVKDNKIKFCISYPKRGLPEYLFIKDAIQSGVLGKITYARIRNAHDGASAGWLPPHFYDPVSCCGGAMMDLGAHPMYMLADLFGLPLSISSIFTSCKGTAVEDNAVCVLNYGGLIACSETGFVTASNQFSLEITGEKGGVFWGGAQKTLLIDSGDGYQQPQLLPEPLKKPIDIWVDSILYDGEIGYTIEDAVMLTQIMAAAYRSYETGKVENL